MLNKDREQNNEMRNKKQNDNKTLSICRHAHCTSIKGTNNIHTTQFWTKVEAIEARRAGELAERGTNRIWWNNIQCIIHPCLLFVTILRPSGKRVHSTSAAAASVINGQRKVKGQERGNDRKGGAPWSTRVMMGNRGNEGSTCL